MVKAGNLCKGSKIGPRQALHDQRHFSIKTEIRIRQRSMKRTEQLKKRDGRQRDRADQTGIPRRPVRGIEQPFFVPIFA